MAWQDQAGVHADDSGEAIDLSSVEYSEAMNAYGGQGNDTLRGNSADNLLQGNAGDDQLWGSTGNDTLDGGSGHDLYGWGATGGKDQIVAGDNSGDGLLLAKVTWDNGGSCTAVGNDLHFALADGSTLDLRDWYNAAPTQRVQSFIFADNTAYGWNNGVGVAVSLADSVYETNHINQLVSIDAGNATLTGGRGNDSIRGGDGNDQLYSTQLS